MPRHCFRAVGDHKDEPAGSTRSTWGYLRNSALLAFRRCMGYLLIGTGYKLKFLNAYSLDPVGMIQELVGF